MARLGLPTLSKRTKPRSFGLAAGELSKPILFSGDTLFPIHRDNSLQALLIVIRRAWLTTTADRCRGMQARLVGGTVGYLIVTGVAKRF